MPVETTHLIPGAPRTLMERQCGKSSTGFFAEDISRAVDWNIHTSEHTAILHLGGPITKLESQIESKGGKLAGAKPGELWLVPAGSRYHSQARGADITYAVMTFPAGGEQIAPQIARFDPFLLNCFRRMASAMAGGDAQSQLLVEQLQTVIQSHLILTYGDQAQLTSRRVADEVKLLESERIKLLDYIDANLDGRLRISDLAELMGRTTHQLVDARYDAFGMPPARVVMEHRLRRARELLASSRATVTAIAVATGFSSHSHFIRAFQQHYTMTPTQFRAEQLYFADERNCMWNNPIS